METACVFSNEPYWLQMLKREERERGVGREWKGGGLMDRLKERKNETALFEKMKNLTGMSR